MIYFINFQVAVNKLIIGMHSMEIACLLPVDRKVLPQVFTLITFTTLFLCQKTKEDFNYEYCVEKFKELMRLFIHRKITRSLFCSELCCTFR